MNDWLKAGEITRNAREFAVSLTKEGEKLKDICQKTDEYIKKQGAIPAFPSQLSLNNIAAHFCPTKNDETTIKKEDVVKIDVGACYNGAIGDTAVTINLDNSQKDLISASKKALEETQKILQIGTPLKEIGKTIQETIQSFNLEPIKNLGGHGLNIYEIHDEPHIPNYNNNNLQELKQGQRVAIEPFATKGDGFVKESGIPTLFSFVKDKPVRLPLVRDVLKHIKTNYNTLPFTTRWLEEFFPTPKINFALKKMLDENIIISHPPLLEKKLVSQHEHTFLIEEKIINTTKN